MISNMVDIYYLLVKEKRRTLKQVPANLQAEVKAKLDADNVTT